MPVRSANSDVSTVVDGAAQIGLTAMGAPVLRHWFNRWGTDPVERTAPMPGDEIVPHPKLGYTRGITIGAPPEAVWPWLVQIGHERGGLYSFDALENLAGCGIHSAEAILDEHQDLRVGDTVRMGPEGYPCFRAVMVDPPANLVLLSAHPLTGQLPDLPAKGPGVTAATWQWQLTPAGTDRTRLVVRQRLTYPVTQSLLWHLTEPVTFVMERRMLLGLKERAERHAGRVPAMVPG